MRRLALIALGSLTMAATLEAQPPGFNYDESKVPPYVLPDPLVGKDGKKIADPAAWGQRRAELLAVFSEQVYGRTPPGDPGVHYRVVAVHNDAVGGKATRKQVQVLFSGKEDGPRMDLLIYTPNAGTGPFPAFLGLNFQGNHAVDPDPRIPLATCWFPDKPAEGYVDHRATEKSRGSESSRWPLATIIERGYAVATACYNEIDPDFDDGFKNGVHPLLEMPGKSREADAWGSIGAWAWGLSRALDFLQTDKAIDGTRIAVWGHSRLGKAALWAGAQDERFAMVVSNESGCGGAALSKRIFGETVGRINTAFPHWFCDNFQRYNDRESELPVDQHELIGLIAPRPVLVCSAAGDLWADPRGEFLGAKSAEPVYKLLGQNGLGVEEMPEPGQLVGGRVGYFVRPGEHDVQPEDWVAFLDFADRNLPKPTP